MTRKGKFFNSKLLASILLILTVIGAILFRASRSNWVFIGTTVGYNALPTVLLGLIALCAALIGIHLKLILDKCNLCHSRAYKAAFIVLSAVSCIMIVFTIIYAIGLATSESGEVFLLDLKKTLTESSLLLTVPFFALFYQAFSPKVKKTIAILSVAAIIILGINQFFPLSAYKITSTPMVIDNGNEYSIVFSTSDCGTAWAEYTYNGKEYKVYDNTGGRKIGDSKIHSVFVPYEHLRNNTYKIGSTRVIEEFSYGSRTGKTVKSDEYTFTYNSSENQTWLVISDWHTMLDTAYKAIDNLDSDYDAVIMLGDASPGVDFEEQVITNTVQFGGEVSEGTKPVLYVRGNHETRGSYAKDLPTALGMEQFYYTTDIGPYSFIVLDSGEDKDDSHIEYGGMTDYNTYRADMIDWLEDVEVKNENVIALSHSWEISSVEEDLSYRGWSELDRLGTRLLLSGHEHKCRFLGEKEGKEKELKQMYPDIIGYVDGGKSDKNYVASMLSLKKDGFEIYAVDNNGKVFANEKFEW